MQGYERISEIGVFTGDEIDDEHQVDNSSQIPITGDKNTPITALFFRPARIPVGQWNFHKLRITSVMHCEVRSILLNMRSKFTTCMNSQECLDNATRLVNQPAVLT